MPFKPAQVPFRPGIVDISERCEMIVGFECTTVDEEIVMGDEILCQNKAVFDAAGTRCCFPCARACLDAQAFYTSDLRYIA